MNKIIIGADGGGTKTKYAAWDVEKGCVISSSESAGINSSFIPVEEALSNILFGVRALSLGEDTEISALCIGDPSLDESGYAPKRLEQAIRNSGFFSEKTQILSCSDVFMALYALTRGAPGALIVAGTGSMGVGLCSPYRFSGQNDILTVGGWGGTSPDPGSGYAIAVSALQAAMDAFDEIAPHTGLCREALRFFGAASPRELAGIADGRRTRAEIARFAVQVDECAQAGDPVAERILREAGTVLGKYAVSLLKRRKSGVPWIGIYGSVLTNSNRVRTAFEEEVYREFPDACISLPETPPELGAVCYALDVLQRADADKAMG